MGDLAIILKLVKGESVADELQNRLTPRVAAAAPAPTPPRIPRPTPESPLRAYSPDTGSISRAQETQSVDHGARSPGQVAFRDVFLDHDGIEEDTRSAGTAQGTTLYSNLQDTPVRRTLKLGQPPPSPPQQSGDLGVVIKAIAQAVRGEQATSTSVEYAATDEAKAAPEHAVVEGGEISHTSQPVTWGLSRRGCVLVAGALLFTTVVCSRRRLSLLAQVLLRAVSS